MSINLIKSTVYPASEGLARYYAKLQAVCKAERDAAQQAAHKRIHPPSVLLTGHIRRQATVAALDNAARVCDAVAALKQAMLRDEDARCALPVALYDLDGNVRDDPFPPAHRDLLASTMAQLDQCVDVAQWIAQVVANRSLPRCGGAVLVERTLVECLADFKAAARACIVFVETIFAVNAVIAKYGGSKPVTFKPFRRDICAVLDGRPASALTAGIRQDLVI